MIRILLLVAALFASAAQPVAAGFSSLFVFGDSLSDNGNAFALSDGRWPPSPPYAQQFSNGPVAAERLADRLGVPLAPSVFGGTNFAVGGATTGLANFNFEVQLPFALPPALDNTGLLAQVGGFLASAVPFSPADSLFMVWAAPNDFFLALAQRTSLEAAAGAAVVNLASAVGALTGVGATQFLVPNMANLAETPFGLSLTPTDRLALAALSLGFNDALMQAMAQVRAAIEPVMPDFKLIEFDTAAFQREVIGNPAAFGFSNVTAPCFDPANPRDLTNVLGGCEGFLFFDTVHPTAAAHLLLGDQMFASLPEPATWILLVLAAAALLVTRRRARAAAA